MIPLVSRRRFVQGLATAGAFAALPWPLRAATSPAPVLSGTVFDLTIGQRAVNITGQPRMAMAVNDQVPAPILRWREGDTVTLRVTNRLSEPTSIHWHGIILPNPMDGVPGLTFHGIAPGETFTYQFPVRQSGTYWYHSHSGFQEQQGLYGPLVIEPKAGYPQAFDRDYVVFLSDWTDENPHTVMGNLKFQSDYYNRQQRTLGTFIQDVSQQGLAATVSDRLMWGEMRMSPTDILDVNGSTYTYLINGQPPASNWTGSVPARRTGASAFHQRLGDEHLRCAHPRSADDRCAGRRHRCAPGHDRSVPDRHRRNLRCHRQPREDRAFTIFVQAEDRSGFARATLAPRPGMAATVPPLDPRPMRTMADMGMEHGSMGGMEHGGAASMQGMAPVSAAACRGARQSRRVAVRFRYGKWRTCRAWRCCG